MSISEIISVGVEGTFDPSEDSKKNQSINKLGDLNKIQMQPTVETPSEVEFGGGKVPRSQVSPVLQSEMK